MFSGRGNGLSALNSITAIIVIFFGIIFTDVRILAALFANCWVSVVHLTSDMVLKRKKKSVNIEDVSYY